MGFSRTGLAQPIAESSIAVRRRRTRTRGRGRRRGGGTAQDERRIRKERRRAKPAGGRGALKVVYLPGFLKPNVQMWNRETNVRGLPFWGDYKGVLSPEGLPLCYILCGNQALSLFVVNVSDGYPGRPAARVQVGYHTRSGENGNRGVIVGLRKGATVGWRDQRETLCLENLAGTLFADGPVRVHGEQVRVDLGYAQRRVLALEVNNGSPKVVFGR